MSVVLVIILTLICSGFPQQGIGQPNIGVAKPSVLQPIRSVPDASPDFDQSEQTARGTISVSSAGSPAAVPAAGLVISIDAESVFENALAQSWNCVNDQLGKRAVCATAFSKINYQIKPRLSFNGALIELAMTGVAFGESTASKNGKQQIFVDTLTRFKSRQMLLLHPAGIEYGPADLKVNASQSFNRTESSNPLSASLVRHALKKPSPRLKQSTESFAKNQIERGIYRHLVDTCQQGVTSIQRLSHYLPALPTYDWIFSSDEKYIFASAGHFDAPVPEEKTVFDRLPGIKPTSCPINLTIDQSFAEQLLNDHLSNREFSSQGIEKQYNSFSNLVQLPKLGPGNEQIWTIQLDPRPAEVRFATEVLSIKIKTRRILSDEKSIDNMVIGFHYRPMRKNGFWYFVRDGEVSVSEAGDNGDQLGARQLGFRTVMRKRLERVIPKYFAIKKMGRQQPKPALDLEVTLDKIQLMAGSMNVGFRTR